MASAKPVRVLFHDKGRDLETSWCIPLGRNRFRLQNILFLHEQPVQGDEVEARPDPKQEGQLTFRKVTKPCGRYAMIVDYPSMKQFAPLRRFLKKRGVESEGCFGPDGAEPGRLYLAVPKKVKVEALFEEISAKLEGLVLVHPTSVKRKRAAAKKRPARPRKT